MLDRRTTQAVVFSSFLLCVALVVAILFFVLFDIISKGIAMVSWEFLTQPPRNNMREGGILTPMVGTILLSIGAMIAALPVGVLTAIYLSEYAREGRALSLVNSAISNLAGLPSIVFGLFGLAVFVNLFGFGPSLLAGSLTLGLMSLPVIIKTSQEAFASIPFSFREASLALGATKWQTIRHHLLPYAMPGILTGLILGVSRAAGETAPILFTVAAYFLATMPSSVFDQSMALPYHLYILSTQSFNLRATQNVQYGTALVLLSVVLALNSAAIIIRAYFRRKYRW
ncbi:MAG: phosphate ABC transporter permease PstA [Candidatus Micrarchaeota archaeon]|nr:phosphate ABC transporter permease PstA [Candidatus Micrarchaeota archaeon]